jgi:hypothetical protein
MFQKPQAIESFSDVETVLTQWWQLFQEIIPFKEVLFASETKDWGSLANGSMLSEDVTVTGAALGDFAIASMSVDVADLNLEAQVTASNTVTVVLTNNGAVDPTNLGSGTLRVMVIKTYK